MCTQASVVGTIFISFDSNFDLGLIFFRASIRPAVMNAPLKPPAPPINPNVMACEEGKRPSNHIMPYHAMPYHIILYRIKHIQSTHLGHERLESLHDRIRPLLEHVALRASLGQGSRN